MLLWNLLTFLLLHRLFLCFSFLLRLCLRLCLLSFFLAVVIVACICWWVDDAFGVFRCCDGDLFPTSKKGLHSSFLSTNHQLRSCSKTWTFLISGSVVCLFQSSYDATLHSSSNTCNQLSTGILLCPVAHTKDPFTGFVLHFYALYVFSFFSYTMPPGYIFHFSEPWQHHHMTPLLFFIFWMIFLQASLWPILLKACVPVSAYSFIHGRPSWCSIFFESFSTCTFLIIVIIIYRNYYHLQRFVVSAWP